ncbi:putative isrso16-transposase orfa protein [Burkholderia pseudomallei MSHR7343]|nr:putative isrso16-transposase orfa protein [Burkholderia pseudomallei MSHR4378]KGS21044.1 putative isrso16-transposase orfa protein [Burkholderia pseudomallei MSHR7343]
MKNYVIRWASARPHLMAGERDTADWVHQNCATCVS